MQNKTYITILQPLGFQRDAYVSFLNFLFNKKENLFALGYVDAQRKIEDDSYRKNYVISCYETDKQDAYDAVFKYISVLARPIAYDRISCIFDDIKNEAEFLAIKDIEIDASESFLNIFTLDESVLFFSLQLCIKHDEKSANPLYYKTVMQALRQIVTNSYTEYVQLKQLVLNTVHKDLRHIHINIAKNDIFIPENSAHMYSAFIEDFQEETARNINAIHFDEENVGKFEDYVFTHKDKTLYSRYGWSYTTQYAVTEEQLKFHLQIIIHLDARWFFWKYFNSRTYKNLEYVALTSSHDGNLQARLQEHDTIVSFSRILAAKESQFIATLRPWQQNIYNSVHSYWKLGEHKKEILHTLESTRDIIERKIEYSSQKIQKKQSMILFIIAIVQMYAFIGYINDYLNIIKVETLPSELHFIDSNFFADIVFVSPLLLAVLILPTLYYITTYSISEKLKNIKNKVFGSER